MDNTKRNEAKEETLKKCFDKVYAPITMHEWESFKEHSPEYKMLEQLYDIIALDSELTAFEAGWSDGRDNFNESYKRWKYCYAAYKHCSEYSHQQYKQSK